MERMVPYMLVLTLISNTATFTIRSEEASYTKDDQSKLADPSRLKQLIHILESLQVMNELQNTVRVTSRQTRTDIVEKSVGRGYKRGYGDSAVLPPWNEFCRLVGMRNCFSSGRS